MDAPRKPRGPLRPRGPRRKLPPPRPHPPTTNKTSPSEPLKTLQGVRTRRNDTTPASYARNVLFITRKTGLGMMIGRCRSLLLDEGYTHVTLHALSAAIPQAFLLLHAILDVLPFPKSAMRYEIYTGSVECVDEVEDGVAADFAMEASVPKRAVRVKSSLRVEVYVGDEALKHKAKKAGGAKKPRLNKKRRAARAGAVEGGERGEDVGVVISRNVQDEEMAMNADELEEETEMLENR